jgi:hypothetical protein
MTMMMIKKLMSNGKILIATVLLLATVSAPAVIPVIAPQYACFIPTFEKVMEIIGIGDSKND